MKHLDASKMTPDELREAGVPYLVDPDSLKALGLNPDDFLYSQDHPGGGAAGWALDRTKHRDIISRVQAYETAPAVTSTRN
jgi:hypothetical protein